MKVEMQKLKTEMKALKQLDMTFSFIENLCCIS
jgi:hypothetical protein